MVKFKGGHLRAMNVQDSQRDVLAYVTDEGLAEIENSGDAFSFVDGEEVIGICGVLPYGDGRGLAWSFLSADIGCRILSLTRAVRKYLAGCNFRRIEMAVDCDLTQAHRWAIMLGFTKEADRMRKYSVDGRDNALYAWVGD